MQGAVQLLCNLQSPLHNVSEYTEGLWRCWKKHGVQYTRLYSDNKCLYQGKLALLSEAIRKISPEAFDLSLSRGQSPNPLWPLSSVEQLAPTTVHAPSPSSTMVCTSSPTAIYIPSPPMVCTPSPTAVCATSPILGSQA